MIGVGTVDFATYVAGLAGVVVVGVVRNYGLEPPASLNTADLPSKFLRLPIEGRSRFTLAVDGANRHGTGLMTCEVVIVIEPIVQDMPEPNFTRTVAMVDNVTKAFSQADVALSWPESVTVAVRADVIVAGIAYWAVVASIRARG